ncbi:uncharacterized protein LOC127876556 isoform X2 [Dreissena polymorpha]|nr:uncharacterized protein LOC127876556 isoform X2 [Dreissena polymorpha]
MNSDDCKAMLNATVEKGEANGKMVVTGAAAEIALFDACNPREMTIAIPRHQDPDITVFPTCTRVKRCGGCCTSDVFSCEPTATQEKYLRVFDTRLPYPGAHRFQFMGTRVVTVIEHTQCDAQCKTKSHECHKYQVYEDRKCRCVCRPERQALMGTCSGAQIWDDSECDCICPNRNTVSCPEPSYFSTTTCKCTLKTEVTGEIDLDKLFEQLVGSDLILKGKEKEDSDIDLIAVPGILDGTGTDGVDTEVIDETTPTTTTTSTTTTEPTTTTTTMSTTTTTETTTTTKPMPHPCASTKCFGVWKPVLLKNNRCQCMPPNSG